MVIFMIISLENICYANRTFQVPREDIIVNIWSDCDDMNAKIAELQRAVLDMSLRNHWNLNILDGKLQSLASLNGLLLNGIEEQMRQNYLTNSKLLSITVGMLVINVIFMFSIIVYVRYRVGVFNE